MDGEIADLKLRDIFTTKQKRLLVFSPRLRLGEGINPHDLGKLKHKLMHRPLVTNVVILTLPSNPSDQLELISSREVAQPFYAGHELRIVGIAADHEEALKLVEAMTRECLEERGDCLLKEYLTWQ